MPPGEKLSQLADSVEYYNGTFLNKRKKNIYCYYWKPRFEPRALLLISHGYSEHSSCYSDLAKEMAKRGFFVFAHDHSGHGHSDGIRGYVSNINDLVEDSVVHIKMMRQDYPDIPLFVCGHSMGGTVATLTSIDKEVDVKGIVLIAPAFGTNPATATTFRLTTARLLSKFFPHFPIAATDFSLICRDEQRTQAMYNDPLRYKGWWKVSIILSLIDGMEEVQKRAAEVKVPILLFHGEDDLICHIGGSSRFYENSPSSDKTFKVYPKGYHSLLNEPDDISTDVFALTVKWLEVRAGTQ